MIPAAITSFSQPIPFSPLQLKPSSTIINGHLLPPFSQPNYPSVQYHSPLQRMTKFSLPYHYPPPSHVSPLPFNTTLQSHSISSSHSPYPKPSFFIQPASSPSNSYEKIAQPQFPDPTHVYRPRKSSRNFKGGVAMASKSRDIKKTKKSDLLRGVSQPLPSKMNHKKNTDLGCRYEDMKSQGMITEYTGSYSSSMFDNDDNVVVVPSSQQTDDDGIDRAGDRAHSVSGFHSYSCGSTSCKSTIAQSLHQQGFEFVESFHGATAANGGNHYLQSFARICLNVDIVDTFLKVSKKEIPHWLSDCTLLSLFYGGVLATQAKDRTSVGFSGLIHYGLTRLDMQVFRIFRVINRAINRQSSRGRPASQRGQDCCNTNLYLFLYFQ